MKRLTGVGDWVRYDGSTYVERGTLGPSLLAPEVVGQVPSETSSISIIFDERLGRPTR